MHGNRITGYDKKYGTGYAKRDGFHTGSLYVIAELPLYRTNVACVDVPAFLNLEAMIRPL